MAERTKTVTLSWLVLNPTDVITRDIASGYWRNSARAERVIDFIECLTVPSGVVAGGPMVLREFQTDFIYDVYEPCDQDGRRIVRDAVLSMGRKNGKTALISALNIVHLVGPEAVQNGEVYSGANDRDQAAIVFKVASQFVKAEPGLAQRLSVVESTKRIACHANGSFYRALSREAGTKHGLNPTFAIYDELAQARDRELYDALNTGFGARDEPLFAVISTQSRDPQHILSELIDRGLSSDDPTVVCHLYAVPEQDDDENEIDIYDESYWKLANPALGDFLTLDSVRKLAKQSEESPSFEPSFRNLSLNQRVDVVPCVISARAWRGRYDAACRLVPGEDIYLGLDLSATTDLTALVAVSAKNGERLAAWFWKPKDLLTVHATRDRAPYERWVTEGFLYPSPGKDVDYTLVALKIIELSLTFNIVGVAFDRWRISTFIKCFEDLGVSAYYDDDDADGIRFVEWGQGYKDMGPAVDALDKAVASERLIHDGHPVLTWCFSNAVATMDPAGNRKLDKSKARFRIDGAVAAVMAIGLKARDNPDVDDDYFDDFLNNPVSVAV